MVVVSYSGREVNAKIVYYGPGLSGKTTNLEKIYDSVPETNRGRMVSMKTQTDRTLFFDLLPLDLGDLQGMKTRLLLYTVPGQVYYNATRKLVLKGVDALVFVADSAADKMAENRESLANLEMNLKAHGIDIKSIPLVMQYNKRDLPTTVPVEDLNRELNRHNVPWFEAQAANGVGVFETLRGVSKLLLAKISKEVLDKDRGAIARPAREAAATTASDAPAAESATAKKFERAGAGGKLLKYLKRGKGAREDAPERAPLEPAREVEAPRETEAPRKTKLKYEAPLEPAPLLSDEALIDDAPGPVAGAPRALNAEEELILTDDDLVDHRAPSGVDPSRETVRASAGMADDDFSGEFEREREGLESRAAVPSAGLSSGEAAPGETRRITIPIELGSLPRSGTITLTFELSIRVASDEARKTSGGKPRAEGLDESFTHNIEIVT